MSLNEALVQVILDNFTLGQIRLILIAAMLLNILVWGHTFGLFKCQVCMVVMLPILNVLAIWWLLAARRYIK